MGNKHNKLKDYLKGFISVFDFTGTSEIKKIEPVLCETVSFITAINDFGNKAVRASRKSFLSVSQSKDKN